MSKTKKGSKGIGYEYWSARPGNSHGATPGKVSKTITKKKERAKAKQATDDQVKSARETIKSKFAKTFKALAK